MEEIKRQKAEWEAVQDAHAAQIKELNDRHTTQEYEVEALKRKVTQLDTELAAADATIHELKENEKNNGNLDAMHNSAQKANENLQKTIDEYDDKFAKQHEL
jgi:chromosome segregation ATPase